MILCVAQDTRRLDTPALKVGDPSVEDGESRAEGAVCGEGRPGVCCLGVCAGQEGSGGED